jgi:AcrR family transcriptional regulator
MGNREDLLAGAKRCLYEKGYARTTARDIANAAGVSLAAIGYHFRSKEALLNEALIEAVGEWGAELERALATDALPEADPLARFEAVWTRVVDLFPTYRRLWIANFDIVNQIDRMPEEVRRVLSDAIRHGCLGLAALVHGIDPATDEQRALTVGSFDHALLLGLMAHWVVDPEHAPSGRDLADALRTIAADAAGPAAPVV